MNALKRLSKLLKKGNFKVSIDCEKIKEPVFTKESVDKMLKKGAKNANELNKSLDSSFTLSPENANLVLK